MFFCSFSPLWAPVLPLYSFSVFFSSFCSFAYPLNVSLPQYLSALTFFQGIQAIIHAHQLITSQSGSLTLTSLLGFRLTHSTAAGHLGLDIVQVLQTTSQDQNSLPSPLNASSPSCPPLHEVQMTNISICPIACVVSRGALPLCSHGMLYTPQILALII